MPKHNPNTTVFTMRITKNSRPDGNNRYNVTLPKQLGDEAWTGKNIKGSFDLDTIDWHERKDQPPCPEVLLILAREANPWIGTQGKLLDAKWEKLYCLKCGRDVKLFFPPDASEVSYVMNCECGSSFFCDKRDTTMKQLGEKSQYEDNWKILHNYDIRTGMFASDQHPDFDMEIGELYHVFFSKEPTILPADFPLRTLDEAEIERLLKKHSPSIAH